MRDELHLMELVDRYLDGSMNTEERAVFEARAKSSSELRELLDDQRALREGVARAHTRMAAAKAYRSYRFGKPGPWLGGMVIIAITAVVTLLVWTRSEQVHGTEAPMLIETLDTKEAITISGVHDDLEIQVKPGTDTTVLLPSGIVLDIPKGCFLDDAGNSITSHVTVGFREAFDPVTIMKAGLSTMSGDTLLETGGMFHLMATVAGREVRIAPDKPIIAMVPADPGKEGMQLYQGVELPDGSIDWRDPRPLKKTLVPVDITTLDLYPPGYEAKLAELGQGVTDKVLKDSLYYSFAGGLVQPIEVESDSALASDTMSRIHSGIDPARIRSIWNSRFNGTNLATRNFEERLQAIHRTCDNELLDLYVNNLDKDLQELDERAVRRGYKEFAAFAARRDGRVQLPAESAQRLASVYRTWSRAAAEAARMTQAAYWSEQRDLDESSQRRKDQQAQQRFAQDFERFQREYDRNVSKACDQLGIKKVAPSVEPPILAYEVRISRSGWWNIDRAVYWITADRMSASWQDPRTGRTTNLEYAPLSLEVADRNLFDDVVAYVIPKELNSYQRMEDGGHLFRERLNRDLTYDVVCLALRNGERYIGVRPLEKGELEARLELSLTNDTAMEALLAPLGKEVAQGLTEESRFAAWQALDDARRAKNRAKQDLRSALLPVVLPCAKEASVEAKRRTVRDRPARFPGGEQALTDLLTVSLRNGDDPLTRFIEGRVEVEFWILEDGTVHDPRITRLLYPTCDRKAMELFMNMPKWEPAIRGGKPTRLRYAREVSFVQNAELTIRRRRGSQLERAEQSHPTDP